MSGRLAGKAAIVTGAGRGIGQAIVARFVAEGAKVAAIDLRQADADAAGGTLGIACDVSDSASVAAALVADACADSMRATTLLSSWMLWA